MLTWKVLLLCELKSVKGSHSDMTTVNKTQQVQSKTKCAKASLVVVALLVVINL